MTTGFISDYAGGMLDLDRLFHPGSTGGTTGFTSGYRGLDLAQCFEQIDAGTPLPYNTGFIALDGRDLRQWFCALNTRVADWPVGGGFMLQQPGQVRLASGATNILTGRMSWVINGHGGDNANTNLVADPFVICPGAEAANAGLWQDYGGYQRGVTRRLPLGSVLRFEYLTINLAGSFLIDLPVTGGEQTPGWFPIHTGSINFCSNVSPYFNDPMNINGFTPLANTFYGAFCPYLSVTSSQNWQIVMSAGFACHTDTPHLNEHRAYVTRIA